MIYFLIGMPGSGKTTLGRSLANELKFDFYDIDYLIAQKTGRTIPEIFEVYGEDYFRSLETKAIESIDFNNAVIATGGGAPCHGDNMALINRMGVSVYLDIPVSSLVPRLLEEGLDKRPLLKEQGDRLEDFLTDMLSKRLVYYNEAKIKIPEHDIHSGKYLISFSKS